MEFDDDKPMIYIDNIENIEYILEFQVDEDKLLIKVKENNEFAPFTYEGNFSREEFIRIHKIFKSCKSLDEILGHLKNLYKKKKLHINDVGVEKSRNIYFNVMNISGEEKTDILDLEREMVKNKDYNLIRLYNEQKRQIKIIKELETLAAKGLEGNELRKKALEILKSNE